MNPLEKAEEIIACSMDAMNEALDGSLLPESHEYMKTLIRMQLKVAIYEAIDYMAPEIVQAESAVSHGNVILDLLGEADSTRIAQLNKSDPYEFEGGRIVVNGGGCSPR